MMQFQQWDSERGSKEIHLVSAYHSLSKDKLEQKSLLEREQRCVKVDELNKCKICILYKDILNELPFGLQTGLMKNEQ